VTISIFLRDAFTKKSAHITKDSEVLATVSVDPPMIVQKKKVFRQYLTVDGLSDGSADMGIDGSSTNVDFYVEADSKNDRYITNISMIMAYGTSSQPYKFADVAELTNGIRFFYESAHDGEIDIHDGMKSNQDLFRISHISVDANWELRGIGALNDYGYFITVDLESFSPPYGIKLDRGTRQRLVMCVRDDCTDADDFNAIAIGFDRFE